MIVLVVMMMLISCHQVMDLISKQVIELSIFQYGFGESLTADMMIKRKTEKGIKTLCFNNKTTDNALA